VILDGSAGAPPLPREMEGSRILAAEALAAWGLSPARLTLLEHKKNITFRLDDVARHGLAGGRYLLRLCDPAGYAPEAIASEAEWLLALRSKGGLAVPEPVPMADGSYVARSVGGTRHAILFRWIPGTSLDSTIVPEVLVRLGELLGKMHDFGRRFVPPPGFTRPLYDCSRMLGDPEVLPPGSSSPLLTRRDRDLLAEAARAVRADLEGLGDGPEIFGMIHADPEPDNMVQRDGALYPIDFADCGWGYWLYDLAAALLPLGERRDLTRLRQALLEGYQRSHPLPAGHVALLDTFLIIRGLFAIRWMLVEGWWREAVRAYATTAVPHLLREVRGFLDRRAGAVPGGTAPPLARLGTVRFLASLRGLGIQLAAEGDRLRMRAPKGALTPRLQEEIAARKPEILAALRRAAAATTVPPLVRAPHVPGKQYPLSYSQRQLWLLDQLDPGNPSYNIPQAIQITGSLRPGVLAASLGEVVRRQASLRTTFAAGAQEPLQIVAPRFEPRIPSIDLRALPGPAREAATALWTREEARRPFDLAAGPLLRFTLLRIADEEHLALVTAHHIVSDGQSGGVLIRELVAIYVAFLRGQPSPLPEPPVQYTDYAEWQRQWLDGERLEATLDYWRRQLRDAPAVFDLPFDRPRPSRPTPWGGRLDVEISAASTSRLRELGRAESSTLFMVLLAGFAALLHRLSGRRDVVLGSPVANRSRAETAGLIGFFVNTVVLRLQIDEGAPFRALLTAARRITQEAHAHQDLPFAKLVEELRPERSLSHTPLFQVLFNFQSALPPEMRLGGLLLHWIPSRGGVEKFELNLGLRETREGVAIALSYKQDLFDPSTIVRLAEHYLHLLDHAVTAPDRPVRDVPLLSAAQRQQLVEWNDTAEVFAGESCLHELILAQAVRTPDAPAVVCEGDGITYRELARRSGRLATHLRRSGVGLDALVGLCVERSVEMVVGILAILRAGAAYVPLDPGYPPARLDYMLADSGAAVLLTTGALADRFPASGRTVIRLDDGGWDAGGEASSLERWHRPGPPNLAYVIYTSGSTGQPKGAMNTHEGVRNRILWAQRIFGLTSEDRVLQKTPFSFDVSVWELLWPLMVGARLVMARPGGHLDPVYLIDLIARQEVTTLHFVPPMLGVFLEQEGLQNCRSLRRVLASGEALPAELERRCHERLGWTRLFNLYGPTEASIDVSWWPCTPSNERTSVPIGRPTANVRLVVLDAAARPVLLGAAGELHIGGIALARGYWRRPALTAERFVPDPVSGEAGARLYRTGDLARFRPGGEIEYLGRIDHQVKVRGFRIELGEIEAVLRSHPAVRDAVVVVREDLPGLRLLAAYLVAAAGGAPGTAELRAYLGAKLPEYMVPAAFVRLDELPLNPNGKLDRKALPAPERSRSADGEAAAPTGPMEELLAEIWAEVLGLARVGVGEDFFALGGHSLLATQVVSRLRSAFGVDLPLRTLFERPTVAALAQAVHAARGEGAAPAPPVVPVPRTGDLPLSFAQQRLWLLDQLEPQSPAYNIPVAMRLTGDAAPALLARVFAEVVRRHEALRTRFENRGGEPAQVIDRAVEPQLPLVDLSGLPGEVREERVRELAREHARRPFDLRRGPLLRLVLWRLLEREHVLGITLHHIVADGWSLGVLLHEVAALLPAFARGLPSPLPELPVQYSDFAVWQRTWLSGKVLEAQLEFWRTRLAGAPRILDFPTDRPRPPVRSSRGAACPVTLGAALSEAARGLCRRERVTPFMALLAAWAVLLGRHARQDDLLLGAPAAGRTRREIEGLIGFFVNTLVLRADLTGAPSFREALRRLRGMALDAFAHQDLPFERLVEELAPERDLSVTPLFQVLFALQNAPVGRLEMTGLTLAPLAVERELAKFDLALTLAEGPEGFAGVLEHDAELFDRGTAARLAVRFSILLEAAVAAPQTPLQDLPLLGLAERQQLLAWGGVPGEPSAATLHGRFEERARQAPGAIAAVCGGESLTYGELNRRADQVAWLLRGLGVGPEERVGLCAGRSLDLLVGLLGILKAGGAYVPLDPRYPAERLAWTLEDAAIRFLVGTAEAMGGLPAAAERILVEDLPAQPEAAPVPLPTPGTDGSSLAYVIYTSGSTGRPKGALLIHGQVVRLFDCTRAWFGFGEDDVWTLFHSFAFDFSVWEIWGALLHGGRLVLVPDPVSRSPEDFHDLLARERVTVLNQTPSAFAQLQRVDAAAERAGALGALRLIIFGGEALEPGSLAGWFARHGDAKPRLINMYGITETTVHVTYRPLHRLDVVGRRCVIGGPLPDLAVHVLDPGFRPSPIGVPGELVVAGAGLARGYLGRPDLTAERFVPDAVSGLPGARIYRSGDLARYLPDGDLEYLGRIDHQVKIRGFRIEPAEIEAALASHPDVQECLVVPHRDASGEILLVAYWVAAAGRDPGAGELREHLRRRLPEHMVPSRLVALPAFPLTPNGKVDRKALAKPSREAATAVFDPPVTPTEEIVAAIWAEVLEIERVGRGDHFFERGGHSLRAAQVAARLHEALGVALPVRRLFEAPTLAALAAAVDAARPAAAGPPLPPLAPTPRDGVLPLSFAQQRLWFLDRLVPDSPAYNIGAAVRLAGPLALPLLRRALAFLAERHETLRTCFPTVASEPAQIIAPTLEPPVPAVDLSGLVPAAREREARRLARAEARRPFHLASGPLVRLSLLRLGQGDHLALLSLHHIVADGWSIGVLLEELTAAYSASSRGVAPRLPPLAVQYADYAVWQRRVLTGERLAEELAWWKSQLAGVPASLPLPADHQRPAVQSWRGGVRRLALSPAVSASLAAQARRESATLFMIALAGFGALLGRLTGAADLTVGSPVAGRERRQLERLIGFFVNTLVLRVGLAGNPQFRELLAAVRRTCLEAYAHQALPFERLVEELAPARDLSYSPLFQVVFSLQNAPRRNLALPGIAATVLPPDSVAAKFDLTLTLEERDGSLAGTLEYRADLFAAATVARLASALECLLAAAAGAPETPIRELPLLDPGQRHQVLVEWGRTEPAARSGEPVPARVAEWARTAPAARALVSASGALGYGQLLESSRRLAWHLRALGVGAESVVAVLLERSVAEVVALLAVLEASAAYLPLDPAHPPERLSFQVRDAGARVVISTGALAPRLLEGSSAPPVRLVLLDRDAAAIAARPADALPGAAGPENLAYVIYTSGSTGIPKGVAVEHRALANLVAWHQRAFAVTPADRATRLAGLSFDAAVWELWPYLAAGASVAVPPEETRISPEALRDWLLAERITIAFVPTPMAEALLAQRWPVDTPLRRMLTGGDRLHRHPPADLPWLLVNNYGPTETGVVATSGPVPRDGLDGRAPSIGRPIDGAWVYLSDRHFEPVLAGAPGEICIGGGGLARGYLGSPDLTAEHFVPDPWSGLPGARMYRSGDLARHRADGALEFLGRLDDQMKIRGFRVEPGEIAMALVGHPAVRECAVLPREGPGGEPQLVAWVVPAGGEAPVERELRAFLRQRLPAYMVPSAFAFLPSLPLTAQGKIDRRALAALRAPVAVDQEKQQPPRDLVELRLIQLWEELLGGGAVGVRDDFFERGGHSLLAVRLVAEIRARFGRELPLAALFAGATVERLAAALREEGGPSRREVLVPIRAGGGRPPLFLVHPVGGNVLCYAALARRLGPDQPVWGIQSPDPGQRPGDLPGLAAAYLDAASRVAPEGLRNLGGWSLGAVVAFEMAGQLAASGRPVDRLLLLDPPGIAAAKGDEPDPQALAALFARDLAGLAGAQPDFLAAGGDDPLAGLLAAAWKAGALPDETGDAEIRALFALFRANLLALRRYTPASYPGRAVVFRATDRGEERDPMPGWRGLVSGGLEVETLAGDHWSLLHEPQVGVLAESLTARLEVGA
jgi:amino acid adenylation domain-containing protein